MQVSRADVGAVSAEFVGTLILMVFGLGVEAQVAVAPDGSLGDHDSIAWTWGIAVTIAVYVSARLSGGHLNPAVTIALAAFRRFPWRLVAPYAIAQTLAAFVAAGLVRLLYADLLDRIDPGHTIATQGVYSTLPGNGKPGVSISTAFFDQVLGTALLVLGVVALLAVLSDTMLANLEPIAVGLLVVVIGMSWGANAGYAINPARDFGPRVLSLLTGYESAWFDQNGFPYWWLPIIAPIVGGILGAAVFVFGIEHFFTTDTSDGAGQTSPPMPTATSSTSRDEWAAANALAAKLAADFLTWDEDAPMERGTRLAPYLPDFPPDEAVAVGSAAGWDGHGRQRVVQAPYTSTAPQPTGDGQLHIDIAALVQPFRRPWHGATPSTNGGSSARAAWVPCSTEWVQLAVVVDVSDGHPVIANVGPIRRHAQLPDRLDDTGLAHIPR